MTTETTSYVVTVGTAFEGITLYGPFDSASEARQWHEDVGLADSDDLPSDIITVYADYDH